MTERNRWVSLFLTLMFLTLGATGVWAQVDLKIADVTVPAGSTDFEVTVDFSAATTTQGGEFDIAYDDTVLTFKNGTPPADLGFSQIGIVDGNIKVMLAGMSAVSVTTAATLTFDIAADASGTTPLTFADTSVGFDDGSGPNTVIFTPVAGSVSVATNPEVTGIVGQNGAMTVDGADASGVKTFNDGDTPTYIIDPDDDYRIAAFTVDTVDKEANLTDNGDGTFSYTLGSLAAGDSRTVEVTFELIPYPLVTVTVVNATGGGISTPDGTATGEPGQKKFAIGATPTYKVSPEAGNKVTLFEKVATDGTTEDITLGLLDNGDGTSSYTLAALAEGANVALNVTFGEIILPTVTKTESANVTITSATGTPDATDPNKKSYAVGATPVYTITPDTGYKIATLTVDGADAMAALVDNTYTFAAFLEGETHTITATSELIEFPKITGTAGENGTLTVDGNDAVGEIPYDLDATPAYKATPAENYKVATFMVDDADVMGSLVDNTYTFATPLTEGETHTVAVTFEMDNMVPVATAGDLEVELGAVKSDQLAGTDEDGTIASFQILTNPTKGFVDITDAATGAYTYEPRGSALITDTDSFTFTVTDDKGAVSEPATINVTFTESNTAPVAEDGMLPASTMGATVGQLVAIDADPGDTLTFTVVTQPATGGMVMLTDASTGAYTFNPFAGASGTTTFTFKATDNKGADSNEATITVNFAGAPPEVTDGVLEVSAGGTASGTLVASDPDGDSLTISIVTQGTMGTATVTDAATGAYSYTANADATAGTDTFTFKANDGTNDSAEATVTVTITTNEAPVASDGALEVMAGETATGTLIATDAEGDPLTYSIVDMPANGGVTITDSATGAYSYTANAEAEGTDTFTFKANDGADSNVATVTVTIIPLVEYEITAIATPALGGSVTPTAETVTEGDDVTFTVTVNADWEVVTVTDNGTLVTLEADNTYTITAVDADHNIIVTFALEGYYSSADMDWDYEISLSELLSVVQLYTIGAYHCDLEEVDDDGYAIGDGDQSCAPHTSDYLNNDGDKVPDWEINLSELLRVIQFYVLGGYHAVPEGDADLEGDGFIAGPE